MKTVKKLTLVFTITLDDGKDADARALNEFAFIFLGGNAEVAEHLHVAAEELAKKAGVEHDNSDSQVDDWSMPLCDITDAEEMDR